jgi:PAS domain S-box-containing protein
MRIRSKLFLLLLPAFATSAVLMTAFSRKAVQGVVADESAKRGVSVLSAYAGDPAILRAVHSQDENGLLRPLNQLVERTGAAYAMVLDVHGRVLAHTDLLQHGKTFRDPVTVDALAKHVPMHRVIQIGSDPFADVSVPIWDNPTSSEEGFLLLMKKDRALLGVIRLGLPLRAAYGTSARISQQVFLIIALVTGLTLFLILAALQRMLAPVPQLVAATKKLSAGSLGITVRSDSRDELGELASSFNQMSRALAETTVSSEFLNSILTNMKDPVIVTHSDGKIRLANSSATEMLSGGEGDLLGAPLSAFLADTSVFFSASGGPPSLGDLPIQGWDTQFRSRDGREIPVLISLSALSDVAKGTEGYILTAKDITEQKRAARDLQESISLLRATLDSTTDGILVVDVEGSITNFNQNFVNIWGIPESVLSQRDDKAALAHILARLVDADGFLAKVNELYESPDSESFDILEFKDGHIIERFSRPQRIAGRSSGRVWSFRDITERAKSENALRQSEESLRQAQKMEAIGTLAGGVAHDFNNLLTIISGYTQLILHSKRESDPEFGQLQEIHRAADRAGSLTRQLLAFSRRQILQPKNVDLNSVLAEVEKMLRRLIGEDIQLVTVQGAKLGSARVDPGQIEQVLMNLVINARDAMPDGGRLTIETSTIHLDESRKVRQEEITPGDYVSLEVSDTGCGMDAAILERIFEPFFTTKEQGKGTGLGLSTVYGIVKQSGGSIFVESQPGQGTKFQIYFPRVEGRAVDLDANVARPEWVRGSERILLVEDEAEVRRLIYDVLTRNGYAVTQASNGREAIALAENLRDELDLLLTDVVMPQMGGGILAQKLTAQMPELRVLFMSGYTDDAIVRHGLGQGAHFLQKPFTVESLLRGVREVLDLGRPAVAGA